MNNPRLYWVGFNLVKGIGAARLRALLNHFGDAASAWGASAAELRAAGLAPKLVEGVLAARNSDRLEQTWQRIEAGGIQVLTWEDEAYPARLSEIDQPPPVLYLRGELKAEDEWAVGVVGTRRITAYGRQVAEDLCQGLARSGVTVVSGLARGVDAVAHKAALAAGGRTIAVLGCGVDVIYPPEHAALAEKIMQSGALVSDYAPGTPPDGINFPPRNRIISGLSKAVVVVEAGDSSGALITAEFAVEQGRDVFAVPGPIQAPQSIGCNRLIQQGARPMLHLNDILETMNLTQVSQQRAARAALPADETEARLLAAMSRQPLHVDDLRAQTGLPIEKVSAALTLMELKGMVQQVGGMHYVAVREQGEEYS